MVIYINGLTFARRLEVNADVCPNKVVSVLPHLNCQSLRLSLKQICIKGCFINRSPALSESK